MYNEKEIQDSITSYIEKVIWIKNSKELEHCTEVALYLLKCCYGILKKIHFRISDIEHNRPLSLKGENIKLYNIGFSENESTKESFFSFIGNHLSEKYISLVLFSRDKELNKDLTKKKLFHNFLYFLLTLEAESSKLFFELL